MSTLRFAAVAAILATLLAFLAGCGGDGPLTGRVEGYVYIAAGEQALTLTRADNTPAVGAEVRVQGTTLQTVTDSSGFFALDGVPAGPRTLVITYPGFQSLAIAVNVIGGATTTVTDRILTPATRKWTVLVYMNADNDLERFGIQDMNEMESVPDSDEVTVLVQFDRIPGYDTSNGDWTGARRFQVRHDDDMEIINSPVLEDMGEVDMGNPETLRDFIAWGQTYAPAEHYLLVIWNHGAGWRTRAMESPATRGVSFDDTFGTYIKTVDLPGALVSPRPLDLVAFDASLMQMLEIAYEIRHTCRYIVGSEESPPGAGYAYHTWLGPLVANPSMTPRELAETVARETLNYYGRSSNITHSVLETARLPELAAATDAFARALIPVANSYAVQLAEAREGAESFAYREYKDLYHYAQLVKQKVNQAQVRTAADGVMAAVTSAVVAEYHGDYHPNAHGVSIYVPVPSQFARTAAQYLPLALARDTQWDEWLGKQAQ